MITLNENKKTKQITNFILTISIIFILSIFLYFLFFVNKDIQIRIVGFIMVCLLISIWLVFEYKYKKPPEVFVKKTYTSNITRIVLITRDGEREREWYCNAATSFSIGKSTKGNEVDIDLTETYYAEYISNDHAVLNFSMGYWYIEDLGTLNGVGLKRKGEEYALKLLPYTSYKVDCGDIIYISKVKLYLR